MHVGCNPKAVALSSSDCSAVRLAMAGERRTQHQAPQRRHGMQPLGGDLGHVNLEPAQLPCCIRHLEACCGSRGILAGILVNHAVGRPRIERQLAHVLAVPLQPGGQRVQCRHAPGGRCFYIAQQPWDVAQCRKAL